MRTIITKKTHPRLWGCYSDIMKNAFSVVDSDSPADFFIYGKLLEVQERHGQDLYKDCICIAICDAINIFTTKKLLENDGVKARYEYANDSSGLNTVVVSDMGKSNEFLINCVVMANSENNVSVLYELEDETKGA